MRERVSLYIYKDGRLLVFKRVREDRIHHVAIGGGVEPDETILEAALREAKEETNFDIILGPRLWVRELENEYREYAYLVTEFSGELTLGGPEMKRQTATNRHIFQWIPLNELSTLDLYPGPLTSTQINAIQQALS
jgi:8-oxo-dGTP pyrophosphatase MutT (NUDIX family)